MTSRGTGTREGGTDLGRWLVAGSLILALAPAGCRCGSSPPDAPAAAPVPEPAPQAQVRLVRLDTLLPTPPSSVPTTAMLRPRAPPPSGQREQVGEVAVMTQCGSGHCVDGLRDLRSGKTLLATTLTPDEEELVATSATFERAVRIAYVGEAHLSAYQGFTEVSGGAHANNELACATWERQSGQRVKLSEVVPEAEAHALTERASEVLQEFLEETGHPRYHLEEASFLLDSENRRVTFCALAPFVVAGTIIEVSVDRPSER